MARNLAAYPFPWRANERHLRDSARDILDAVARSSEVLDRTRALHRPSLTEKTTESLLDWRLVSREWVASGEHRWLIPDLTGHSSLTTHEEDHIRIQTILPGFQPAEAQASAASVEAALAPILPFSHSPTLGFLTTSLTNVGTGMRLSVFVHAPGLEAHGNLPSILRGARSLGCAVRGLFGEGSAVEGSLYQISNSTTFGNTAEETVSRLLQVVRYLITAERGARKREFGTPEGQSKLTAAVKKSLETIGREDATPSQLLAHVSVLRLGASEGLLAAKLTDTSAWLAIAGASGFAPGTADTERGRFEAVRRTAALRQALRVHLK
ncbi:MAG: hypothetical protein ABJA67_14970 [Chthonomonadales bacterium]